MRDASYTEMLIDNAATASQNTALVDDRVTREAIRLNIIDPLLALASHEPAPTDTQEGLSEAGEVVGWAAFDLEADFMAAFANERAVSGYVERVGEGAIHPLVRQSALTACQQEVERLRDERDEAQNRYSSAVMGEIETTQRAAAAESRNAELVKVLEEIATRPEKMVWGEVSEIHAAMKDMEATAIAALGGQSNEA